MGIKNSIKFKLSRGRRGRRGTRRIRKRTRQIRRLRRARLTRRIRQGSRQYMHGGIDEDPSSTSSTPSILKRLGSFSENIDTGLNKITDSVSGLAGSATQTVSDQVSKASDSLKTHLEAGQQQALASARANVANAKALGLGFIRTQANNVASFADKMKS